MAEETIPVDRKTKELVEKAKIALERELGRPITYSEALYYLSTGFLPWLKPIEAIIVPRITRQVSFRYKLDPLKGVKLVEGSPLAGTITEILMNWPSGCEDIATGEGLVDIAFGHKDKWVFPHIPNTFLCLSNTTPLFRISEPVGKGEELWVVFRNADLVNVHTVSVAVTIEGVE